MPEGQKYVINTNKRLCHSEEKSKCKRREWNIKKSLVVPEFREHFPLLGKFSKLSVINIVL